ncbi:MULTISPECIES: TetR/AcrR family transcriptional regulator [Actinoalloteichus]|uniref:Transcriptional regulator, TetR family n=1 Tax=Actinoalloteichus fjordicus TaxID=1612552 RepID=A0AAC9LDJ5_9PSEU|nr:MULTISPECIES: TetR/AcrR family transcriptional regulator [Actinoalloteichus]APU14380.1 transcriptional regulator, TetR family [Actinoalloteichus fjordicus]APU20349.1 transcriptional regulator, TetR family [Actinoalloteichus sp. GBA129-24]
MEFILEAAAQLFDRDGLAATTNHIAERAGVSIGTVYQYFPNKQALLYALALRHVEATRARLTVVLAELRSREPPFADTMAVLATEVAALHHDRPRLHALMHRHAPRVPAGLAVLGALTDRLIAEVAHHLRRCGRGDADATVTAATLVHALDAQLHHVLLDRSDQVDRLVTLALAITDAERPD